MPNQAKPRRTTFVSVPGPRPSGQPEYKKDEFDTQALEAIDPMLSFITCSGEDNDTHPHPIALELYEEMTNAAVKPEIRKSHEFYGMDSADRKKKTSWSRPLVYTGFHLMQCLATAKEGKEWATWCTGVCFERSLPYARRWQELFPNAIDPSTSNR